MLPAFIALSFCCIALAIGLGLRHEIRLVRSGGLDWHAPISRFPGSLWSLLAWTAGCLWTAGFLIMLSSSAPWAAGCSLLAAVALCLLMARAGHQGKSLFLSQELQEVAWIVRQRGSVQDQIMRACEREAMERRLRRCQATLMLTRRGGNDLAQLFNKLEEQVALMEHDAMEAADVVGGFAAHLRHVFMESDCDDIPIGEACQHIARWAQVLEQLGASAIHITGVPAPESVDSQRRIPALLMLGATERLGVAALQEPAAATMHWHWSIGAHSIRLEATGGAPVTLAGSELRDWDAAFMLRHGGIAHAGGAWSFELPLLPGPESGFEKPHKVFE